MATERPARHRPLPNAPTGEPLDWRTLRLWHIQPIRDILALAMVFGVLYFGYVLSPITVPMLLALLLAYLFEPLVQRMTRRRRVSRHGAALFIIAAFFLVVLVPLGIGLGVGIGQAVSLVRSVGNNAATLIDAVNKQDQGMFNQLPRPWQRLGDELIKYRKFSTDENQKNEKEQEKKGADGQQNSSHPDAGASHDNAPLPNPKAPGEQDASKPTDAAPPKGDNARAAGSGLSPLKQQVYGAIFNGAQWVRANADTVAKSIGQQALATGQGALALLLGALRAIALVGFTVVLTSFFFFFFCTGWGKVLDFWANLIPERKKSRAFELIARMDRVIAGFVRGRLTICAIMMLLFTLGYWIIGVPTPFLIGPLVGLFFLVPFLHILSIPLAIILLWLQPSSVPWQNTWWWIIFAPVVVDLTGQFLDDWILSPTIQGKTTNMDVPTIVFASMAGGALAGLYGLLVAIPVAACIRILVNELFWPRFQRWARGEERDFLPISSDDPPLPAKE